MFFRKKKIVLELIKTVELSNEGWKTHFWIKRNGSYILKSCFLADEEDKANKMFDELVSSGGHNKSEQLLRKKTI